MEKLQLVENINKTLAVIFGDRYKISVTDTAVLINGTTIKEYKPPLIPQDILGAVSLWVAKEYTNFRLAKSYLEKLSYIDAVTSTECRINEDIMSSLFNPISKGGKQ